MEVLTLLPVGTLLPVTLLAASEMEPLVAVIEPLMVSRSALEEEPPEPAVKETLPFVEVTEPEELTVSGLCAASVTSPEPLTAEPMVKPPVAVIDTVPVVEVTDPDVTTG